MLFWLSSPAEQVASLFLYCVRHKQAKKGYLLLRMRSWLTRHAVKLLSSVIMRPSDYIISPHLALRAIWIWGPALYCSKVNVLLRLSNNKQTHLASYAIFCYWTPAWHLCGPSIKCIFSEILFYIVLQRAQSQFCETHWCPPETDPEHGLCNTRPGSGTFHHVICDRTQGFALRCLSRLSFTFDANVIETFSGKRWNYQK